MEASSVGRAEAAVFRAEEAVLRAEQEVKEAKDELAKAEQKYQEEPSPQAEKIYESAKECLKYAVDWRSSTQGIQRSAQDNIRSAHTYAIALMATCTDLQLGSNLPKREGSNEQFDDWVQTSKASLAQIKATDCDIRKLCDPAVLSELCLPLMDLTSTTEPQESTGGHVPVKFSFMGRVEFQKVFDWIKLAPSREQSYYTGLPGGKSYIFAAAALLLFKEFEASNATPRRRLIYLQGNRYVNHPLHCLLQALVLAYSDDPSELRDITTKKQLTRWMSCRKDHLFFLVDDGKEFDGAAIELRVKARTLLERVASLQSLVVCSSVRGDVHARISSQKPPFYLLASPTFTEVEVTQYLKHFKPSSVDKLKELRQETGWVPRLLWFYGTDGFEMAIEDLLAEVEKYIKEAKGKGKELEQFMKVVAGQDCRLKFPKALLSKCFYSKDGKGACLTDSLLHMTKAKLFETLEQSNDEDNTRRIQIWTQTMPRETLKSRLGQNAEAAAILAVKFGTTITIDGKRTVKFTQASAVTAFDGEAMLGETFHPRLHIPNDFRHAGLDFYYEDSEVVVCFQVTVATDPVPTHPETRPIFLKVTERDQRVRYLIWVVHGQDSRVEKKDGYYEVFCCFRDLHYLLKPVHEACIRINGEKPEAKVPLKTEAKAGEKTEAAKCKAIAKTTGKCKAIAKTTGKRCKGSPVEGTSYCNSHKQI